MKNIAAAMALGALSLAAVAAQHGTATSPPSLTISGAIGGYQPVSDVGQHARMSADVCAINTFLDAKPIDWAAINMVYRAGKYSAEGNGSKRTFGKFARDPRSTEYVLGRYERHFGAGWLDTFASAAINGTGPFAREDDLVRRQGAQKAVRDQMLVAWTFHELDASVAKATRGDFDPYTGAPHNWDEARAYYHGEKPECAPFATSDERGREFGTASAVNARILTAMRQGLEALLAKDVSGATKARDEIVRNITITYVQSAIKYATVMNTALAGGKTDDARIFQAEGWAYFRVIEPLVAERDAGAARAVSRVFDLGHRPAGGAGETVEKALSTVYTSLGITRSEIGVYRAP